MQLNERQNQILEILQKKERASTSYLASRLYVSEMTIRRDLQEMEQNKLIARYHGGAMILENLYPIHLRKFVEAEEKREIAQKAKKYLRDNLVIYLDESSTCLYLIPHLKDYKNIKIITNSIHTMLELSQFHIPCTCTGGDYLPAEMCFIGSRTEEFLRTINPDLAFFSTLGISSEGLITDIAEHQLATRKIVLQNSRQSVFLYDSSKLNKIYPYTLCTRDEVTEVIVPG